MSGFDICTKICLNDLFFFANNSDDNRNKKSPFTAINLRESVILWPRGILDNIVTLKQKSLFVSVSVALYLNNSQES